MREALEMYTVSCMQNMLKIRKNRFRDQLTFLKVLNSYLGALSVESHCGGAIAFIPSSFLYSAIDNHSDRQIQQPTDTPTDRTHQPTDTPSIGVDVSITQTMVMFVRG